MAAIRRLQLPVSGGYREADAHVCDGAGAEGPDEGGGRRREARFTAVMAAVAGGSPFGLDRTLNFRSHGAVGPQLTVYAAVVTVNFLALILGLTTGLAALGLDYRLARLTAAGCECVYMYAAMRWLVFRDAGPAGRGNTARKAAAAGVRRPASADPGPGAHRRPAA